MASHAPVFQALDRNEVAKGEIGSNLKVGWLLVRGWLFCPRLVGPFGARDYLNEINGTSVDLTDPVIWISPGLSRCQIKMQEDDDPGPSQLPSLVPARSMADVTMRTAN